MLIVLKEFGIGTRLSSLDIWPSVCLAAPVLAAVVTLCAWVQLAWGRDSFPQPKTKASTVFSTCLYGVRGAVWDGIAWGASASSRAGREHSMDLGLGLGAGKLAIPRQKAAGQPRVCDVNSGPVAATQAAG